MQPQEQQHPCLGSNTQRWTLHNSQNRDSYRRSVYAFSMIYDHCNKQSWWSTSQDILDFPIIATPKSLYPHFSSEVFTMLFTTGLIQHVTRRHGNYILHNNYIRIRVHQQVILNVALWQTHSRRVSLKTGLSRCCRNISSVHSVALSCFCQSCAAAVSHRGLFLAASLSDFLAGLRSTQDC